MLISLNEKVIYNIFTVFTWYRLIVPIDAQIVITESCSSNYVHVNIHRARECLLLIQYTLEGYVCIANIPVIKSLFELKI